MARATISLIATAGEWLLVPDGEGRGERFASGSSAETAAHALARDATARGIPAEILILSEGKLLAGWRYALGARPTPFFEPPTLTGELAA